MNIIQIGSIAILQKWLLLGLAVLLGMLFMKFWLRRFQKEENQKQFDLLSNTLFIGFLIWKGSLFLFEPDLIWKSPFSLLYFTGGNSGLVLAIILSTFFFIYKAKRKNISTLATLQIGFLFSFVVLILYHALSFTFQEKDHMLHFFLGTIALFILIFALIKKLVAKVIFSSLILFSFINLVFPYIFPYSVDILILFTAEQWLFLILIIFSLIFWDKKLLS